MTFQNALAAIGIAGVAAGLLLLAGGTVLLLISIIKTVRGKKRIGGIVGGGIMTFGSLMLMIMFGSYIFTAGILYDAPYSQNMASMITNTGTALRNKDADYLAHLFAKESYSGEPLEKENADTIIGYIDGDIKTVTPEAISVDFNNGTYAFQDKYTVITEDSEKYVLYIYFVYGSDNNKDYVGIQHIKMYEGGKVLEEFGTAPVLN